ncbi:MAG: hypothetical protein R3A51_19810 [Nannocystaceae bacterium]
MPAALWEALAPLGFSRVGDLLRLPATELRRRFGREAAELHARLGGAASWQPLQPALPRAVPHVELSSIRPTTTASGCSS